MSESEPSSFSSLPPADMWHIDRLCTRFETALKRGERPQVEDYLQDVREATRPLLRRELLALEVAYRPPQGEDTTLPVPPSPNGMRGRRVSRDTRRCKKLAAALKA